MLYTAAKAIRKGEDHDALLLTLSLIQHKSDFGPHLTVLAKGYFFLQLVTSRLDLSSHKIFNTR
jgi:hypothetical protein